MMNSDKKRNLSIIDILNLGFLFVIFVFALITLPHNPYTFKPFLALAFALALVFLAVAIRNRASQKDESRTISKIIRGFVNFYPLIFFFVVFESFYMILPFLNPHDYDKALAQMDYALLGVNPTVWIETFFRPWLTDLMYLLYFFYFPFPLFILIYLFRKGTDHQFNKSVFIYLLVYYGAYIIYFIVPARGPHLYAPIAHLQTRELTGIFLAGPIRSLIGTLEPNKFDAFPSLHTAISLATLILMGKYHKKMFLIFTPVVMGIWISLVYCRYHYVSDMIAGILWTVIAFIVGGWIYEKTLKYHLPPYFQKSKHV